VQVFENGIQKGGYGFRNEGDTYSVTREGTAIYFRKNGEIFHIITNVTDQDLIVDCAIFNKGVQLSDVFVY
jgi:hypothetical protein